MLLDTSGLLCLHHRPEPFHTEAVQAYRSATVRLTHGYVLAEFIALAQARKIPRFGAVQFIIDLAENREIETIWVDKRLHARGIELLQSRLDKSYSLSDAISFVLMRDYRFVDALTTDKHFEQEGFRRLLA